MYMYKQPLCYLSGPAVSYSGFSQLRMTSPPRLGENTVEVLRDLLGYDSEQIRTLVDAGSVSCI